jgi:hypothetical protein
MKKIVLLTQNPNGLNQPVTKWLFIILGLFTLARGIADLVGTSLTNWSLVIGLLLAISGLTLLTLGIILFDPKNKLAPKVVIDDIEILIREDIFKRTKSIKWTELKQIDLKSFALDFLFNDNRTLLVILKTTGETSKEIKKVIREMADRKSVNIIGG